HLHQSVQNCSRKRTPALGRSRDGALQRSWRHLTRDEPHEAEARGLSARFGRRQLHQRDKAGGPAELLRACPELRAQQKTLGATDEDRVIRSRRAWAELGQTW